MQRQNTDEIYKSKLRKLERDLRFFKMELERCRRDEKIRILRQIHDVEAEILRETQAHVDRVKKENENMTKALEVLEKMKKEKEERERQK